jgi:hypothetical protein
VGSETRCEGTLGPLASPLRKDNRFVGAARKRTGLLPATRCSVRDGFEFCDLIDDVFEKISMEEAFFAARGGGGVSVAPPFQMMATFLGIDSHGCEALPPASRRL